MKLTDKWWCNKSEISWRKLPIKFVGLLEVSCLGHKRLKIIVGLTSLWGSVKVVFPCSETYFLQKILLHYVQKLIFEQPFVCVIDWLETDSQDQCDGALKHSPKQTVILSRTGSLTAIWQQHDWFQTFSGGCKSQSAGPGCRGTWYKVQGTRPTSGLLRGTARRNNN